ncbi:MAG: indolepyruvate ferredoxin oxidoreductase subunit alpha [Armatimonadota bacterium]
MAKIVIDMEKCKGCGLCAHFCPKGQIRISEDFNRKGHHPCEFTDAGECNGCTVCAVMCPDIAIEVFK